MSNLNLIFNDQNISNHTNNTDPNYIKLLQLLVLLKSQLHINIIIQFRGFGSWNFITQKLKPQYKPFSSAEITDYSDHLFENDPNMTNLDMAIMFNNGGSPQPETDIDKQFTNVLQIYYNSLPELIGLLHLFVFKKMPGFVENIPTFYMANTKNADTHTEKLMQHIFSDENMEKRQLKFSDNIESIVFPAVYIHRKTDTLPEKVLSVKFPIIIVDTKNIKHIKGLQRMLLPIGPSVTTHIYSEYMGFTLRSSNNKRTLKNTARNTLLKPVTVSALPETAIKLLKQYKLINNTDTITLTDCLTTTEARITTLKDENINAGFFKKLKNKTIIRSLEYVKNQIIKIIQQKHSHKQTNKRQIKSMSSTTKRKTLDKLAKIIPQHIIRPPQQQSYTTTKKSSSTNSTSRTQKRRPEPETTVALG